MSVIDRRKGFEDGFNFADAMVDGVAREGNVADGGAEQHKAVFCSARHATVEGVVDGGRGAAPNQRLGRVEREAHELTKRMEEVVGSLKVRAAADQNAIVQKKDVEEQ